MPQIDVLGESQELENYWRLRNERMTADRDIINLVKPQDTSEYKHWISNDPKVFYQTAVALMSSYTPRLRMPLTINFTTEEQTKMNKAERFCLGLMRLLDNRQLSKGQVAWLHELAWWICEGWYSVFTLVRENERGGTDFIADLWDSMTVYPEWDADGLVKLARRFEVDKKVAQSMVASWQAKGLQKELELVGDGAQVKITNYWRRDYVKRDGKIITEIRNALYVGDQPMKTLEEGLLKDLDHIPVHVGAVGVPERSSAMWETRWGENIIAAARDMFDYKNEMLTLRREITAQTAFPNIISRTRSGAPAVKTEDVKGHGQVIPMRLEEQLEILKHAATPQDVDILSAEVNRDIQKATFADSTYGSVSTTEISGFALSQYMAAIKYRLSPYLTTMQYVISNVLTDLMNQYRKGKFPEVKLSTVDPKGIQKGLFFVEGFKHNDVPEVTFIDVTIPLTSPIDKTQQIIYARQAMGGAGTPALLSRQTLWDEILDVQDGEQEYQRILQDELLETDIMKQLMIIEALRKKESEFETMKKYAEADVIHQRVLQLEMALGMRQGIPVSGAQGGIPSNVSPPEMSGMNPDNRQAAINKAPSGLNRPAQTPMQRQQNLGRKGVLVSPSGQPL